MKGQGVFRRMAAMIGLASSLDIHKTINSYPDPVLRTPHRSRSRYRHVVQRKVGQKRRWRSPPPCIPGTITYHDMLVRKFGRFLADQFGRNIQHKDELGNNDELHLLPSAEELALIPDWGWRRG